MEEGSREWKEWWQREKGNKWGREQAGKRPLQVGFGFKKMEDVRNSTPPVSQDFCNSMQQSYSCLFSFDNLIMWPHWLYRSMGNIIYLVLHVPNCSYFCWRRRRMDFGNHLVVLMTKSWIAFQSLLPVFKVYLPL